MQPGDRVLIEDLYGVFAKYERPGSFVGCPCGSCWGGLGDPDDRGDVVVVAPGGDRPLATLDEADLANVVETVPGTSGTVDVYRHYLPRILEILATGGWNDWPEADDVIRRLNEWPTPSWEQWPPDEADAIYRFLERFDPNDRDDESTR